MQVKKVSKPDYKSQTVMVQYVNNTTEKQSVHYDIANNPYLATNSGRLYLFDLPNGDYLEQMLK